MSVGELTAAVSLLGAAQGLVLAATLLWPAADPKEASGRRSGPAGRLRSAEIVLGFLLVGVAVTVAVIALDHSRDPRRLP